MRRLLPALLVGGKVSLLVVLFWLLGGCYILRQGWGQVDILLTRKPVRDYLAGDAPPADKEKVRFILEVKEFGERELGLKATDNYSTFYDTEGKPVSWVVTACRKDRFEPYTWWFPVVGTVPYKGFFDREDAVAQAKELEEEGYDVSLGTVGAYSTLGWFSDPILSTMLDDPGEALADLVLHELTHGHVYVSGRGDFNESLASFVGRQGSLEWFRKKYGENSPPYLRAIRRYADEERFDVFMHDLYTELDAWYRSSPPDVLEGREVIFRRAKDSFRSWRDELNGIRFDWFLSIPLDNSTILGRRRYGRTELFQKLFDSVGGEWPIFWERVHAAAKAPKPFRALNLP